MERSLSFASRVLPCLALLASLSISCSKVGAGNESGDTPESQPTPILGSSHHLFDFETGKLACMATKDPTQIVVGCVLVDGSEQKHLTRVLQTATLDTSGTLQTMTADTSGTVGSSPASTGTTNPTSTYLPNPPGVADGTASDVTSITWVPDPNATSTFVAPDNLSMTMTYSLTFSPPVTVDVKVTGVDPTGAPVSEDLTQTVTW